MIALALGVLGIAVADLVDDLIHLDRRPRGGVGTWLATAAGLIAVGGAGLAIAPLDEAAAPLALSAVAVVGWRVLDARAGAAARRPGATTARGPMVAPLLWLALALAVLRLSDPFLADEPLLRPAAWEVTGGIDPSSLVLLLALGLAQLSTGNLIVTAILRAAHPDRAQQPSPLKGGRLIGPMERLFILGLGLAGQFTAAGMVIAAKSLIRWPELSAQANRGRPIDQGPWTAQGVSGQGTVSDAPGGPTTTTPRASIAEGDHAPDRGPRGDLGTPGDLDAQGDIHENTEYFLVGSFASWLVALASLAVLTWAV